MMSAPGDTLTATPRTWRRRAEAHRRAGQVDLARLCLMAAETAKAREKIEAQKKHDAK